MILQCNGSSIDAGFACASLVRTYGEECWRMYNNTHTCASPRGEHGCRITVKMKWHVRCMEIAALKKPMSVVIRVFPEFLGGGGAVNDLET